MEREKALEEQVQALRQLVEIQKQIIEALKLQADLSKPTILNPQPIFQTPTYPYYNQPFVGPGGGTVIIGDTNGQAGGMIVTGSTALKVAE